MNNKRALLRLSPISTELSRKNPRILLGGSHQPTLLRYLDGWPRRRGGPCAFLIRFVDGNDALSRYRDNEFDLAVIQSPAAEQAELAVRNLTRIARQGLIALG
jgi:hypothetical protein